MTMCRTSGASSKSPSPVALATLAAWSRCTISVCWRRRGEIDGETLRGFTVFVGGGLGTVPHQAKVLADFCTEEQLLPLTQAIARVFARLGEKKNRNRARLKFLVAKLGIDEFRQLVQEELEIVPPDPRHTDYIDGVSDFVNAPAKAGMALNGAALPAGFAEWYRSNVYKQVQPGYSTITLNTPLGDFTSEQGFALADVARKYVGDNIRLSVEQNVVLRWVADADLPAIYRDLHAIGLGDADAGTIVDITTCPGTDTCKLGIASSRGLTAELRTRLLERINLLPDAVRDLKIKVSGCFNSAASITSPISASSATAGAPAITRCRTSRSCSAGNGRRTPAATAWLAAPCRPNACPMSSKP